VQSRVDERVIEKLDLVGQPDMIRTGGGWSAIIAPNGRIIAGPNRDDENILYAELDLAQIVFVKYIVDSAGHYSRPDVLRLWTNYEPQSVTIESGARPAEPPHGVDADPHAIARNDKEASALPDRIPPLGRATAAIAGAPRRLTPGDQSIPSIPICAAGNGPVDE
jgi:hypothetical protein